MGAKARQGPHHGAHQSMSKTPSLPTYSSKFSPVSATVAIVCVSSPSASMSYPSAVVEVSNLSKSYRVHKRPPGVLAALRSVFHRSYESVAAVQELSFHIGE